MTLGVKALAQKEKFDISKYKVDLCMLLFYYCDKTP